LGYRLTAVASGGVVSGSTACSWSTTVRAAAPSVLVHLPLWHRYEYRVGRRTLRSGPDVAVLLSPGHDYTVVAPPGEALAFALDPSLLGVEIECLGARLPRNWALNSMQIPLTQPGVANLRRLVKAHAAAAARFQQTRDADELRTVEGRMAAWLARNVIAANGLVPLSARSRQVALRVDDWIRRHAAEPITLEQLCDAARVSARALQQACLARWGQTPIDLVSSRRLNMVRSLLATRGANSVTEAAVRGGFSHLGRFSIAYRRAFGEAPSETLARASAGSSRSAD
jgi:AraC-like DNA-binding protein